VVFGWLIVLVEVVVDLLGFMLWRKKNLREDHSGDFCMENNKHSP